MNEEKSCTDNLVCSQLNRVAKDFTVLLLSGTTGYIFGSKVLSVSIYQECCKEELFYL